MKRTKDEIQNLSALLISKDERNTEIAISMLEGFGEKPEEGLLTSLFWAAKMPKNEELKGRATKLFLQLSTEEEEDRLSRNFKILDASERELNLNIRSYVKDTRLDGITIAKGLFSNYRKGYEYIFKRGTSTDRLWLLKELYEPIERSLKFDHYAGNGMAKINRFLPEITQLEDLEVLDFGKCSISKIPKEINQLKKLKRLRLYGAIKKIPETVWQLSELEELDIEIDYSVYRCWECFPEAIAKLSKLKTLRIRGFKALPDSIAKLQRLERIELDGFYDSPDFLKVICQLTQLKSLNLKGIKKAIPTEMANLRMLEYLRLEGTGLGEIPETFGNFKKLNYLKLAGFLLTQEWPKSFEDLGLMEELDLIDSQVSICPTALQFWKRLTKVELPRSRSKEEGTEPDFEQRTGEIYEKNLPNCKIIFTWD